MKRIYFFLTIITLILIFSCQQEKIKYPNTLKVNQVDEYFGVEVKDPYRWLEDENSQETKDWINLQNELTFNYLSKIDYRDKIKDRLTEILNYERITAPEFKGGYYFFQKNDGLQNHSVLYYFKNLTDEPKQIIDPNTFSEDGSIALVDFNVSSNGKYLAYSISKSGSDWNEIFVLDINSGKLLEDHLEWVKFSGIAWYKNGFFYSRYDKPAEGNEFTSVNFNHKVFYHKIGTDQILDELIFEDARYPNRNFYAYITSDEKYLIISESETTSGNSIYIKNMQTDEDFTKLTTSFDYEYTVIDHIDDNLYVLTNYKAPKYKLIRINVNSLEIGNWRDIIPEKSEVLEFVELVGNKIVAGYIKDAYSKLELYNLKGIYVDEIELLGIGTINEFHGKLKNNTGFYSFTSFITPSVIYQFNSETNSISKYFSPELEFDPEQYTTKQIFYRSKDGTKIPMFITYKKGIKLDGNNPTLLYGYGGFNISILPSFRISNVIWLENGGIYASANIRGGGEYGENWHLAGTIFNKQNVFDDFIYAAEYLIKEGYTSNEYIAIQGGSNGGLLVGAVVNQWPDLFKVALPAVGVMDMLRYHKFTIGWSWVSDYGSSEDSIQFINLYKYSPLHNISKNNNYPAILVTTADHDDRVVPAHSFKYIATIQEKSKSKNPALIRIQTKAGHGRGKPVSVAIEELSDIIAFTFYNMGVLPIYD
ncbi:MAG: S9 family peptidase [Bacteroidales bacterium]|nr:S9 family peptidase [Bacteroidales bacterium]